METTITPNETVEGMLEQIAIKHPKWPALMQKFIEELGTELVIRNLDYIERLYSIVKVMFDNRIEEWRRDDEIQRVNDRLLAATDSYLPVTQDALCDVLENIRNGSDAPADFGKFLALLKAQPAGNPN
jgi:hypothetical protein